jgi:peptidyl-dipeptidase Dcp
MLKPYFELGSVLAGIFTVADKLFGLTFKENQDIPVYHPEVKAYEVFDDRGEFVAVFYGDYFPREGKRSGAWMNDIRGQKIVDGQNVRPAHRERVQLHAAHRDAAVAADLQRSGDALPRVRARPARHARQRQVRKPDGHQRVPRLRGTALAADGKLVLRTRGAAPVCPPLPDRRGNPQELVDRIRESQNFMEGVNSLTQLRYGLVDMQWHGHAPAGASVVDVERLVDAQVSLFPRVEGTAFSPAFSHIFAGGYSAGYYSYKWSEVLDADAFEYFRSRACSTARWPASSAVRARKGRQRTPDGTLQEVPRPGAFPPGHAASQRPGDGVAGEKGDRRPEEGRPEDWKGNLGAATGRTGGKNQIAKGAKKTQRPQRERVFLCALCALREPLAPLREPLGAFA